MIMLIIYDSWATFDDNLMVIHDNDDPTFATWLFDDNQFNDDLWSSVIYDDDKWK